MSASSSVFFHLFFCFFGAKKDIWASKSTLLIAWACDTTSITYWLIIREKSPWDTCNADGGCRAQDPLFGSVLSWSSHLPTLGDLVSSSLRTLVYFFLLFSFFPPFCSLSHSLFLSKKIKKNGKGKGRSMKCPFSLSFIVKARRFLGFFIGQKEIKGKKEKEKRT